MAVTEFKIKLTDLKDERVQVELTTLADIGLREIDITTQYMMWIYAKESGLPFEEALRQLCDGARNFEGVRAIKVLPGLQTEDTP